MTVRKVTRTMSNTRILIVDGSNVVMRCALGGELSSAQAVPTASNMIERATRVPQSSQSGPRQGVERRRALAALVALQAIGLPVAHRSGRTAPRADGLIRQPHLDNSSGTLALVRNLQSRQQHCTLHRRQLERRLQQPIHLAGSHRRLQSSGTSGPWKSVSPPSSSPDEPVTTEREQSQVLCPRCRRCPVKAEGNTADGCAIASTRTNLAGS